jgi:SulP family sulfate permease
MLSGLAHIPHYFSQPIRLFKTYDVRRNIRFDLVAGLTVAVTLFPQAIAFSLIAELPPEMGLYTAIIGAAVGALWGSSHQVYTGPTNVISMLVLSVLLTIAVPGSLEFILAASTMAVLVGLFQVGLGLGRLGALTNFVSYAVIVGLTTGAGVLIIAQQLRYLLGVDFVSYTLVGILYGWATHITQIHWPTLAMGLATIALIVFFRRFTPRLPAPLLSLTLAALLVYVFGLDKIGIKVIAQLPAGLPPFTLPSFNLTSLTHLFSGALAIGATGLVVTSAIARSFATQTGQRVASNQEFVGQGLANIAVGFFSGYPCAGSFSASAINFNAGARSPLASVFSSLFVLIAMLTMAPLVAYLPRAALAGVLVVTGYGLIKWPDINRLWRGTRGDAVIMLVTLVGTLFLQLQFAVLLGILFSFAYYIKTTSQPSVFSVLPDREFKHFVRQQPGQVSCPQLGILKISGDLYFGAVGHIEDTIHQYLRNHPRQRFLLLRLHGVNQCDLYGVWMLEAIMNTLQGRGGGLYLMRAEEPVVKFMRGNGFYDRLGYDHFLSEEHAVSYLFHHVLDPPTCIYECPVRAFKECQNLPKNIQIPVSFMAATLPNIDGLSARELELALAGDNPPWVIDIRESREFDKGHLAQAQSRPLSKLLAQVTDLPHDRNIVLVCRSGWRSQRVAALLQERGYQNIRILHGGMLAWIAAGQQQIIEYQLF